MNEILLRLLRLARPIRGKMLQAALLGSCTVASGIGLMATSAYLISAAALHPSVATLQVAIVGVRFFGIARGVFRYLERIVAHQATFRLLASLRGWFYSALEPLLPARVQEAEQHTGIIWRSGDLLRRAVSDIDTLQNFYVRVIAPPAVAAIIGCLVWILLGAFGAIYVLPFLAFFLLASVGIPLLTHLLSRQVGADLVKTRADLHAQMVDSVQGLADLIAFGQEERQAAQIQVLNDHLSALQKTMAYISGMQGTLTNLCMHLSTWVMLLVAIPMVASGHLNGVFLALLVLTVLSSFEVVLPLPAAFQQIGESVAAARRLFEIVDTPPVIHQPVSLSPTPHDYSISVQRLSFRYQPEDPDVLEDINFTLPTGKCIAIVGASGSGKSTLAHLLLRYRDYRKGEIRLGGYELSTYRQEDVYKIMGVVEQDTHLFNTTIRENLLLARSDATEEEMIEAARQAQLHDFVLSLAGGYDTRVGEQGLRLSGGERQRVAIARALLKNAPVLILDEPTVNLDPVSERAILHSLRSLCDGRTTLLITHRLIEMDMVDEILVFHHGRIVERGQHDALLEKEGFYWHLWQSQQALPALSYNKLF